MELIINLLLSFIVGFLISSSIFMAYKELKQEEKHYNKHFIIIENGKMKRMKLKELDKILKKNKGYLLHLVGE